jgi:iron-regulated transporter 1
VLFLATIFPGTLLYASIYALLRAAAATLFSARVGRYIDATDRLVSIRHSILWQRGAVAVSSVLLLVLLRASQSRVSVVVFWVAFPASIFLACCEKLASIGNTVAIERDWVVVICDAVPDLERGDVNAVMRRIDLFCKLIAPVFISFVDAYDTRIALWTVMVMSSLSTVVEYFAIAQVYNIVPALGEENIQPSSSTTLDEREQEMSNLDCPNESFLPIQQPSKLSALKSSLRNSINPWISYIHAPAFLASLSLAMLYLTVLSTGPQWQTYLLATGYTSISVSLLRIAAVTSELLATLFAPMLMHRIGPIRSGLWSVNWQLLWLTAGVGAFLWYESTWWGGAGVTMGIVASRLGLWGFDLSVQFIIQEVSSPFLASILNNFMGVPNTDIDKSTPPGQRNTFSSSEIALQNAFELNSFLSTIVFPRPSQFQYPVLISYGAVVGAAACFAGYVRRERGHLIHVGDCVSFAKGRERVPYTVLNELEHGES